MLGYALPALRDALHARSTLAPHSLRTQVTPNDANFCTATANPATAVAAAAAAAAAAESAAEVEATKASAVNGRDSYTGNNLAAAAAAAEAAPKVKAANDPAAANIRDSPRGTIAGVVITLFTITAIARASLRLSLGVPLAIAMASFTPATHAAFFTSRVLFTVDLHPSLSFTAERALSEHGATLLSRSSFPCASEDGRKKAGGAFGTWAVGGPAALANKKQCNPRDAISEDTLGLALSFSEAGRGASYSALSRIDRRHFFEVMQRHESLLRADTVLCMFPAAACELFMPFNKSLLVVAAHRFDYGRLSVPLRQRIVENLRAIAAVPGNLVAATSVYEAEYIRYYTGLRVMVIPYLPLPFADDGSVASSPLAADPEKDPAAATAAKTVVARASFVLNRNIHPDIAGPLQAEAALHDVSLERTERVFEANGGRFDWGTLASTHLGVVLVPYCVQNAFTGELYRSNIPVFAPSLPLLVDWHIRYGLLSGDRRASQEICWIWNSGCGETSPPFEGEPPWMGHGALPFEGSPEEDMAREALWTWLGRIDIYQVFSENIIFFDSPRDLAEKMEKLARSPGRAQTVAVQQARHNALLEGEARAAWGIALAMTGPGRDTIVAGEGFARSTCKGGGGCDGGRQGEGLEGTSLLNATIRHTYLRDIPPTFEAGMRIYGINGDAPPPQATGDVASSGASGNIRGIQSGADSFLWSHCKSVFHRMLFDVDYPSKWVVSPLKGGEPEGELGEEEERQQGSDAGPVSGEVVISASFPAQLQPVYSIQLAVSGTELEEWSTTGNNTMHVGALERERRNQAAAAPGTEQAQDYDVSRLAALFVPRTSLIGCALDLNVSICFTLYADMNTRVAGSRHRPISEPAGVDPKWVKMGEITCVSMLMTSSIPRPAPFVLAAVGSYRVDTRIFLPGQLDNSQDLFSSQTFHAVQAGTRAAHGHVVAEHPGPLQPLKLARYDDRVDFAKDPARGGLEAEKD